MTPSPTQPGRTARLVAQHARTSALLGVDFVPVFRSGVDDASPGASAGSIATLAPERPVRVEAPESGPPESGPSESGPSESGRSGSRSVASVQASPPAWSGVEEVRVSDEAPRTREEAQRQLDALRARYEADAPHQHFVTDFNRIVFGEGDPQARLMFVGEAPGADEDRTGRPFVGRAGQLLEKMILAMGLTREQVYICNVLKTRPPNNQTPTIEEARRCAPYLREQIRIVSPEVIVTLGLPASRLLLETTASMREMRGRWREYPPRGEFESGEDDSVARIPVMPTYHPAFLLRSYTPENRAKVWADLRLVMDRLGLVHPGGRGSPSS